MEPGLSPERMPARVEQLRQEADRAMAVLTDRIAAAKQLQAQGAGGGADARSGDGRVQVVVDPTGVVTSLTFAPSVFDTTTPDRLASTVVATVQAAAAKARARAAEAMTSLKGTAGAQSRGLDFDVPAAPVTAADPTAVRDDWHAQGAAPAAPGQGADENSERPW